MVMVARLVLIGVFTTGLLATVVVGPSSIGVGGPLCIHSSGRADRR